MSMQTTNKQLIGELMQLLERATERVQQLKALDLSQLNAKENPEKWSALECLEHLNLYGDFYLPEIEKRMLAQRQLAKPPMFKSGVIGNYFANLMLAKNGKIQKMKSPKDKNPNNSSLSITTIDRFFKQQQRLVSLLQQAQNLDLVKTKTSISISSFIKLRLGDTFRFLIYHIDRHITQAEKIAFGNN